MHTFSVFTGRELLLLLSLLMHFLFALDDFDAAGVEQPYPGGCAALVGVISAGSSLGASLCFGANT